MNRFKKKILAPILFAAGLLAPSVAAAQAPCPYIVYGAVLTAAQWQSCFTAKQNALGFTPVNKAGDTMQGRLVAALPSATAGFNLQPTSGAPPSAANGDLWVTPTGFFVRVGGSTIQPYVPSGTSGGVAYFDSASTLASSGLLTSHALVLGGGAGSAPSVLGSLGTTTTILHGNASGAPTFGAVSLTTDVSGILPGANGGTGVANTGNTITIGANVVTTGVGATTLAFGASTQTYTFPTTTATLARTDAGQTFTGANTFSGATTFSSALTYGGVALSNAVTGTGNMVLSASPTFTGTISGAAATLTGTLTTNVTGGGTQCAQVSNTGVLSGTGAGCPSATPVPTEDVLTSGSSATYTTPAGARQLRILIVGGGGGGAGASTTTLVAGSQGGTSTFNGISAIGGAGSPGGVGGYASTPGAGTANRRVIGNSGGHGIGNGLTTNPFGGLGGGGCLGGGAPSNNTGASPTNGTSAQANSGAGGAGATNNGGATDFVGGGGQAGECAWLIINSPAVSYTYTIGAKGNGGSSTNTGGDGSSGVIIVDPSY